MGVRWAVKKCEAFGVPTDEGGHDLRVRHGSPFEAYCRWYGVAFPAAPGAEPEAGGTTELPPLLPEPPAKPKESKLKSGRARARERARRDRGVRRHL
jgi:hypothetical protein